jgi:hypothetical protein
MATITVDLLNELNKDLDDKTLVKKYIIKVTASQLSQYLKIAKDPSKLYPYKIKSDSIIKIHSDIQRGTDRDGFYLQEKRKVDDIKNTLLGINGDSSKAFLGTLVWNIRNDGKNNLKTSTVLSDDGISVPKKTMTIDTEAIYLTDSAHRHFAIVDANETYHLDKEKYPCYSECFEFPVEVYFLDENDEKKLFHELNAKQKKISTTRQKYIDNITPYGQLKDLILEYDISENKYFSNNIELISNTNQNSIYLMTMSVFVACIKEMFPKNDLLELETKPAFQFEFSKYFCDFFFKLADTIVISIYLDGKQKYIKPFENVYQEYLLNIEEEYNNKIETSDDEEDISILEDTLNTNISNEQDRLIQRKKEILQQDFITHNVTLKALSRLGRHIRYMSNWELVITQFQNILLEPNRDTFQEKKPLWKKLKLNSDSPMSIAVNNHNVNAIYNYFISELKLLPDEEVNFRKENSKIYITIKISFPNKIAKNITNGMIKLSINNDNNIFKKAPKNLIAKSLLDDSAFVSEYQHGIIRKKILFEVELNDGIVQMDNKCIFEFPGFDNQKFKYEYQMKNE